MCISLTAIENQGHTVNSKKVDFGSYVFMHILNIERTKNFGGNFHVSEPHKLISSLVLTQDIIFRLRKLLSSVDLYYLGPALQRNKFKQFIYVKIPPKVLCALNVQDA